MEAFNLGISISVRCDARTIGLWDRTRIEQIISNLVSNALKYGEHKPVSVSVERDEVHGTIRLLVRDQGPGIRTGMQEKIFERFERSGVSGKKISGLGLGLYICRQIVEAHGGQIKVESESGRGSTFTVELPLGLGQGMAPEGPSGRPPSPQAENSFPG